MNSAQTHASLLFLLAAAVFAPPAHGLNAAYDEAPINYSKAQPADRVAHLRKQLAGGAASLEYDEKLGYLPALLKHLNISAKSQMLVFSKTSLQVHRISPETPRAVYFNDDAYVGYTQNGDLIEIAATDPQNGAMFYTLSQKDKTAPVITRQTDKCLQCHDSSTLTLGIPGHIMRSVYPDSEGRPIYSAGTFHTTQESPFKERWGGWYVSGKTGSMPHMGNTLIKNRDDAEHADFTAGRNRTDLTSLVDTTPYLSNHSDIVALMVAEHQTVLHNLITRASMEMRTALIQERDLKKALGEPEDKHMPSTMSRLKSVAEPMLKYMLHCDEPEFPDAVAGTSGFAEEFTAQGLKDKRGRSLRDLDLKKRLFKYPCSHLIYSESFDALPEIVLDYVKQRMSQIFEGKEGGADYKHLTTDDRDTIREILAATWKGAPSSWKY